MNFYPKNKYLLVEMTDEKKPEDKTSGFILPNDIKEKVEPYKVVKLLRVADDSPFQQLVGSNILVPTRSVEAIKIGDKTIHIISESLVCGVVGQ